MRKVRLTYFSMKLHDFAWVVLVNIPIISDLRFLNLAKWFLAETRGFFWVFMAKINIG